MKVILLESTNNLGRVGEVVTVRPGYARNFLFPRNVAVEASERNMKIMTHNRMLVEHKKKRAAKTAEEIRDRLHKETVTIKRKAGENEKIFGSVTTGDIEEALRAKGVSIDKRGIQLEEPIKKLGKFKVPIKLDGDLEAKVTVEVVAEEA